MKKDPKIMTFGCRLNTYESEVMRNHAKNAGLEDAIIINTCAVTKEAERSAKQSIRKARKENPDAKIIVTGCAVQISPEVFASMPEVDKVIGNDAKMKAETWGAKREDERVIVNDIMSVRETATHLLEGFEGQSRAFIQVQNGCDHRCTFCIIPYGRGNSRSVPIHDVVHQVQRLVKSGYKEIVLTGVDVTSYGADLPDTPKLGHLMAEIFEQTPDLPRLRLSSLDPVEIDDELWRLIENEPRLMPHLHMSLQAGDDMVLKRMKRRHLRQDAIDMCARARALRPDIVFGADIIAGFPTETDEMFENTYNLVKDCNLTYLHVFPYSERSGTPAAKMPQVDMNIRKERAAKLRALGEHNVQQFLKTQIGHIRHIIIEQDGTGRTEHFAPVKIDKILSSGTFVRVQITGVDNEYLTAIVLN